MKDKNEIKAIEYLQKLTSSEVKDININQLSSAQKARFLSWLDSENIELNFNNDFDSKISAEKNINIIDNNNLGIDIQDIRELFPNEISDLKSEKDILDIFSLNEISYAENKRDKYETLTGIFAAKEAIIKTLNIKNKKLNKINISFDKTGKPSNKDCFISISHSNNFAVSVALSKDIIIPQNNQFKNRSIENNLPTQISKTLIISYILGSIGIIEIVRYILFLINQNSLN